MGRVEAIVLSMTPQERRMPHLIDGSRRKRIAAAAGPRSSRSTSCSRRRKQMQKMMKQMKKGKMPGLPPESAATRSGEAFGRSRALPSAASVSGYGIVKEQAHEEVTEVTRRYGSSNEVDPRRVEEEPGLPGGRGRLALAARRQVHRDRRAATTRRPTRRRSTSTRRRSRSGSRRARRRRTRSRACSRRQNVGG